MGWIEMNEKTKKAQKTKAASLADRYSFGHKALSVVLSVVLLGFGWPAVSPAEVFANNDSAAQSEVAQTQESATGVTDVPAAQPGESASSEQATEAPSANQAADANTAASTSAAAASQQPATQPSQPSVDKAASADVAAQVKSEYDIALELNNASIKKADGTDAVISLPATKVTVPAGNDFKFTVVPDNGYKLNRVLVNVGGQQSPLAADDAGVYTIEASAFEAGVTITLETEKDAVTASVENAVSIDEPVTQESNAAKAVSDGPISGPNVVAQGDSITLTYNGDMKIDNWYGGDGLFSGWEVSADKKTLKLTATSNWAFIGSSKITTISLGYIDGQGVWHNQGDDCFKFNVTVKKRSFTVVQPAAKSVGDDCFWLPQIKDNETGKIIDLSEAPDGSFYPFEYYRDGVKLNNTSQYWHNPDDFKQPGNYTVKIRPDSGWIYDFGDQSEIVVPIPTQKPDDETFEITGPDTVEQFKNIVLKTNADTDVTWTSSDSSIATIDANGKVTGVTEGKITVTAVTTTAEGKVLTATHEVTVTKSTAQTTSAKLFFLKSPTSNPDSNSAGDWFPPNGSSDLNVKVNVDGAAFSGKNTWDNVANRVVSWPDGSTGTSWTLPRANSYWSQVFNNYKNEIQNKLHVSITEDDVEAIILHPYKISKNGRSYHLDCKVEIKVKQVVTATFWIQSPGATGFDKEHSVSTLEVKDGVAQVVAPEAPEAEKTVNGTKYKFMGWYSDPACTQAVTFPITTSENVFYYGKYVPCDQSIQVNYYLEGTTKPVAPSKTLTGYMKGQTVTQEPIAIPGYTPVSGEAKMGVVGTDASIDFYYKANDVKYKVEYYWNGSDKPLETDNANDKCGDTISNIAPKSFSGYTAVNPNPKSLTLSGDEDKNVVKFYYYKNVTLTANSDTKTYNGSEQSVDGYTTNLREGTIASFGGVALNGGKGTNAGDYAYTFADGTVGKVSIDNNYIVTEVTPGNLHISPVTDKVTVTIKGKQDTKSYNGSTQFVTGYDFSVDNGLYAQSNLKFTGDATAKGIAVGSYNMNLAKEQFSNTNENFSNVEFVVEDGWLKIEGGEIDQKGVSWNTHDNQKVYDGTPLAAYAATATDKHGNALNVEYSIDGKTWTSDPSQITITHFGGQVVQLRATGSNYAEGQYATSFESIAITKRLVTLTSEGGNKPYDGTPLTNGTVTATAKGEGVGFIDGEGVSFNVTGSQTEKGESDNTFDYTFNEGTSEADYWVTCNYGKLIVTADDTEVVVTITENGGNVEYDGTEKSVSGYKFSASNELYKESDFTFSGNDTVKGTNVGTYDMELKPSDFTNNNQNFSKVTFVIVNGQLSITPKDIKTGEHMTVEAPANVTYNGQPQQEEPVVKDGDKTLAKNVDYTLSYSKDATNVGTVTVTVTGKGNYSGSADVKYQILKRSVVLESATDSKPYDGTALTRPNVTVEGDGFVDGEVTNVRATGSVTTVAEGEVVNAIVYDEGVNFKAGNYDITKKEGKLSITALSAEDGLTITPNNVEYTYNAESHSAGLASASASVAGTNVSIEYRVEGSPDAEWRSDASVVTAINAGTVTIEVRASADNYSGYKYAKQTLIINKRDVELTSASASKVYDGTALTKDWVDMGPNRADTGFIWTDLADDGQVHATGSQTVVGKSENTISYELKAGAANNYNIIGEHLGTLEVTEQSIVPDPKNPESYTGVTISNPSDSVYNGETHKWAPEVKDAKGNVLVEGTDYTVSYDTDNFTDAKTIKVTITGTGNYTGIATKTYKITPAPLKVIAGSASKPYDGKPLTAGGVIEGLVDGEIATAQTEGSQTEVGSSVNTAKESIEWGTATNKDNYYIQSLTDGKLTVTAKSITASDITVGALPDVVYSGTEQAQKPEVKDGDTALVEGTDYDLDFSEDKTNVGTVTVVVTGKGNYTGEVTRTYQIVPAKLTVTTPSASKVYNGKALTAEGTISGFVNGETAAFNTTGSQTEVGSSTNTYAIDWTGAAKRGNYTISENLGTLTVTETTDEIIATPGNYNGTYDGQTHGVDVTVTGLPEGYSVKTAASYATATDVTDGVIANVDDLVIVNAQGEDVTANLKITKGTGTIKITPATLKVTTYGAKAEYNGNALTADGEVTGFVNNEAAAFTTTGSQTEVGSSTNTYAIDWSDTAKQSNYTVEEHLGTLEVIKNMAAIMVIPQDASKPYDGTALTSAGVTTYGLPAGYTLTATTKGSVTNVGGATAEVDTYSIKDAAGEDVTDQFGNVFTGKATLQVTKRPVTIASASASKVYDGIALTKHEASVTDGSLATGESFSYDFSGERTTVGSTPNAYAIKAGANTDLDNYEITKANGTLTVTAQSINPTDPTPGAYTGVEVDSPSDVTYDANEHKWVPTVIDKDKNKLIEGTDYDVTYSTGDFTNVTGSIKVTIVGKGNYTGTVTRTYQITPASVALSSNSHEFTYTGEPQGDAAVNVSGAAELFQSQVNDLKAAGSVTNVGDVAENSISYNWNDGFTADNYSIETSFGELSVVAKNIDTGKDMSVNDPVNVTYNGGDQTWAPTVNDGEKTLVGGSDYTVSYSTEDRTNVTGAITVTIVGKGNYTGELARTYQVLPKEYSVTTATGSKVYDGKPLKGAELEGNAVDGLVDGSDATFTVTGSQTEVGGDAKNNTYKLTFSSEQMAKNYTLASEQLGTLTVTENADEIVVTTTGGEFTYSGQAHGATVSVSELPGGYTLEKAESSASATNVADGTVAATADTLVIRNAQGKDVTNELKIHKIDGEIQITPAPLNIETGSATKTYDGSALTNATLKVDGLVAGDVVTGRTTGSQTEVGSSANTYTLTWGEVDPANYEITEQLGVLTVEAVVAPVVPGPQQPGGPVVVPPTTTEPAGPADVVADALERAYETVTGDKATEEQIYDSENPLGKEQAAHCWVHWYMILVMILTALYGVAVWLRRGNHTRKLKNDMNNILGGGDDGKDPSGSPVATNHPAGMEA